jgi:hypothetical protein
MLDPRLDEASCAGYWNNHFSLKLRKSGVQTRPLQESSRARCEHADTSISRLGSCER